MALFTDVEVRQRAKRAIFEDATVAKSYGYKTAGDIIKASFESYSETKTYDVFLSHSIKDSELILGVKAILEDLGYRVYVDWIEDPALDRSKVTPATAAMLRQRMKSSKSLLYVTTENSEDSKWMPWECGYFDGLKEKVAIVPVKASQTSTYVGQEYLGLYPYCEKAQSNRGTQVIWVHKNLNSYIDYDTWVSTDNSEITWRKQ